MASKSIIFAFTGLVVSGTLLTCGPNKAGELLVDAGQMLVDGGEGLMDAAGERDARAAPMDLTCTAQVGTITSAAGDVTTRTTWTATDPAMGTPADPGNVDILLCDVEFIGNTADPRACPPGATCSGDLVPTFTYCYVTRPTYQEGQPLVICGYQTEVTPAGGAQEPPTGYRYQTVKIIAR